MGRDATTNYQIGLDFINVNLDTILCISCRAVCLESGKCLSGHLAAIEMSSWRLKIDWYCNIPLFTFHLMLNIKTEVDIISDIDEYQTWPGWLVLVSRYFLSSIWLESSCGTTYVILNFYLKSGRL